MMLLCRAGEEVTISYGAWPNDVFLLFFGFLPEQNEHDAVVLFHSLPDLIACYNRMLQQSLMPGAEASQLQHSSAQHVSMPQSGNRRVQSSSEKHDAAQPGTGQRLAQRTHAERQHTHAQSDRSTAASSHAQHRSSYSPSGNLSAQSPDSDSASSLDSSSVNARLETVSLDHLTPPVHHNSNQSQHECTATGSSSQVPESAAALETGQEHRFSSMQHQTPGQHDMQQTRDGCGQAQQWTVEEQHAALLEKLGPGDWSRCEHFP